MRTSNILKIFFLVFSAIVLLSSCSGNKPSETFETPAPGTVTAATMASLPGKAYITSEGMDANCRRIEMGTDFFERLIFLNDTGFVYAISSCCPGPGEDFPVGSFYTGTYRLDSTKLVLIYDPKQAVVYVKEEETGTGTIDESRHIEQEKSDLQTETLNVFYCKNTPYFRHTKGDFKNECIAPDTVTTAESIITEMKETKVWDKLMLR
jgi:hypothetical protein